MSEEPRRRSGLTGTVIRGVSLAGSGFLLGRELRALLRTARRKPAERDLGSDEELIDEEGETMLPG
ncbi:MAG TPA: hypothetical protein VM387_02685 [Gemmatimonadales bacterium]|nr:hypothetical protein [Gemmatimonadales bacterium]